MGRKGAGRHLLCFDGLTVGYEPAKLVRFDEVVDFIEEVATTADFQLVTIVDKEIEAANPVPCKCQTRYQECVHHSF